jgi:GTP-binding protein
MPGVAGSAAGFAPGFAAVVAGAGVEAGLAGAAVWAAATFMTSIAVMAAAACRNFISLSKGDASGLGALPHAPQPKDYEGAGRARSNRISARPVAVSHTLPDHRFPRVAGYPFMSSNPLNSARFVLAANEIIQLPYDQGAEVAFAGRSNAGKSSALNALTGHNALARTSKTPGRTQLMVVFDLAPLKIEGADPVDARLVDLPGYGYAKVPEAMRKHWRGEIDAYLKMRRSLRGIVLIVDIRHELKDFDRTMIEFCAATDLPCHVLMTKADKLSRGQASAALEALRKDFRKNNVPGTVQIFSSLAKTGIEEARARVMELLATPRPHEL